MPLLPCLSFLQNGRPPAVANVGVHLHCTGESREEIANGRFYPGAAEGLFSLELSTGSLSTPIWSRMSFYRLGPLYWYCYMGYLFQTVIARDALERLGGAIQSVRLPILLGDVLERRGGSIQVLRLPILLGNALERRGDSNSVFFALFDGTSIFADVWIQFLSLQCAYLPHGKRIKNKTHICPAGGYWTMWFCKFFGTQIILENVVMGVDWAALAV